MSETKHNKVYALMLFNTEMELGISQKPGIWVNTKNILYHNGTDALNAYANTKCPASQLIDADNIKELKNKMKQMIINYSDQNWLNENLYPFM